MDDIVLIAFSKSFKRNTSILEREASLLVKLGEKYSISFDIEKTELIHFFGGKNTLSIILSDKIILVFSKLVK